MTNTCPHCGRLIVIEVRKDDYSVYGVPWRVHSMKSYPDSVQRYGEAMETTPDFKVKEATRRSQSRAPNTSSDVVVPFGRTFGAVLFVSTPLSVWIAWGDLHPIRNFFIVFCVVNAAAWFVFTFLSEMSIWVFERITGKDLDGDGQVGKPDRVEFTIKREDKDIEGDSWEFGDFFCPNGRIEYLEDFCRAIIDDLATFSERGSREGSQNPKRGAAHFGYSTKLWTKLRDEFVSRGWAEWRSEEGRRGVELTDIGYEMVYKIADGDYDFVT